MKTQTIINIILAALIVVATAVFVYEQPKNIEVPIKPGWNNFTTPVDMKPCMASYLNESIVAVRNQTTGDFDGYTRGVSHPESDFIVNPGVMLYVYSDVPGVVVFPHK